MHVKNGDPTRDPKISPRQMSFEKKTESVRQCYQKGMTALPPSDTCNLDSIESEAGARGGNLVEFN